MRDTGPRVQVATAADSKPVSMQIVDRISSRLGCDPIEIEPLARSIDPEALDELMKGDTETTVSFDHAGFTVDVSSTGEQTKIDVSRDVTLYD